MATVCSKQLKQYIHQLERVSYQFFDLHLLRNVPAWLNFFLIKLQTDGPMGAFYSEEMDEISLWLIGFFTHKKMLKTAYSTCKLSKLEVSDEGNWKLKTDLNITAIGAEAFVLLVLKFPSHLHQDLKEYWVHMLKGIIGKLQGRSLTSLNWCKFLLPSILL